MLGNLLTHEWKAVWKVPTLLIGILLLMAAVAGVTFMLPIWDSEWVGLPMSGAMLVMVYYFAIFACGFGIMVYLAVRFYKNMFTDEGYLTHTLPVTPRALLLNKVITMSAWNLIGIAAIFVSIFIFVGIMVLVLLPKNSSFARDILEAVQRMVVGWPELLKEPGMEGFGGFCISILCLIFVGAFGSTMLTIGSITLGQMVRKHRILGAIGAYFAIGMAIQFVSTAILIPIMLTYVNNFSWNTQVSPFPVFTLIYSVLMLVMLAVAVGLYFLSEYLVKKQLELD